MVGLKVGSTVKMLLKMATGTNTVAGTIAAKVDGKGVIGVPGALITSLKVFIVQAEVQLFNSASAIEYAAEISMTTNFRKTNLLLT